MKRRVHAFVALTTAHLLLLGPSLRADGPVRSGSILEAIAQQDPSRAVTDPLSSFTLKTTGEAGSWILEHPDATRNLADHLEELARFYLSEAGLPKRPMQKNAIQADVIAQYILVGTLGQSETNQGVHVWGLVQEIASEPLGDTTIFIPIGSASDPAIAIEEAGVLANEEIRSTASEVRDPGQYKIFGICEVDCQDDAEICAAASDAQLSSCLGGCPLPIGVIGAAAALVCAEACGALWLYRNAQCVAAYLTCITLQSGCPASPILLDLDRNDFQFVGLDDSVLFDIDADGQVEELAWTRWDREDAFLCLDRNKNGWIDDGSELFGDNTPLLFGSTAPNGYIALAEFDMKHLGGNDDGFIDEDDAIYKELCVWRDSNHNGHSGGEISDLPTNGIERIGLRYSISRETDQHGNELRYWGDAWIRDGNRSKHTSTVDVFFVKVPD